jgi:hypothetical protein
MADADLNEKIILGLRRRERGVDFLTAGDAGTRNLRDPEVLILAARAGRILVTHDRATMPKHFAEMIEHRTSPGLIVISQRLGIGGAIEELELIWAASGPEDWHNRMEFLPFSGGG